MQADWILCSAHIRLGSTSIRVEGSHFLLVALEFINNSLVWRPLARDGIDTVVGENGVQLLVLDEATIRHCDQVIHLSGGADHWAGNF